MTYDDFVKWTYNNLPEGVDVQDFIEYLACNTANILNLVAEKKNITVRDVLDGLNTDFRFDH